MRTSNYGKIWEMLHSSNRRLDWKRQMPNSARRQTKTWNEYLDKVTKVTSLEKQIADIRKISNSTDVTIGTTRLTDEEKKALEKAEKERLAIKEKYQQSELALMDEGLEKQIKSIEPEL